MQQHIVIFATECYISCLVLDAKPQKCSICGKAFRTQSQVLRHVKQQHGTNIIYHCGLCSYSVIQKCNLKIHMKRHTGENAKITFKKIKGPVMLDSKLPGGNFRQNSIFMLITANRCMENLVQRIFSKSYVVLHLMCNGERSPFVQADELG